MGAQVSLPSATDWANYSEFAPQPHREDLLRTMLADLVAWTAALAPLR